jgi:NAD+ diphosphatase
MLQDISPKIFDNHYSEKHLPHEKDYVVNYYQNKVLLKNGKLPQFQEFDSNWSYTLDEYIYLFSIDTTSFYLILDSVKEDDQYKYDLIQNFRNYQPAWVGFGGATAVHLANWYDTNKYCGRCGHHMEREEKDRALKCPNCGLELFPRINPAIIVGVTNGDKILMTQFVHGYDRYALISGYAEIGETLEQTIEREVKEEVGLSVHNIRYYDSQPWGFSGSLLMGFFADLDEDKPIQLEKDELSKAKWFDRNNIPHGDNALSLTWQMIEDFRNDNF